jgi:hypothetical protein
VEISKANARGEKSASLAKALRFLVEYREYIEYMVQVTLEGRLTEGVFVG